MQGPTWEDRRCDAGGQTPRSQGKGGIRGLKTGLRGAVVSVSELARPCDSRTFFSVVELLGGSGIPQGLAVPQGLAHPLQWGHRAPSDTSSAWPCAAAFLVLTLKDPSPRLERG